METSVIGIMLSFDDTSAARRNFDGSAHNSEDGWREKFVEHHEQMRCFLKYHLSRRVIWTSSIEEMLPYDIQHGLVEAGGTVDAIDEGDWVLLLPLRRVTRRHLVLN